MKRFLLGFLVIALTACSTTQEMSAVIVKDCTGTYLRNLNVDYLVCNSEKTELFDEGQRVTVKVKELYQCKDTTTKCIWYHPVAKFVKVKSVELDE